MTPIVTGLAEFAQHIDLSSRRFAAAKHAVLVFANSLDGASAANTLPIAWQTDESNWLRGRVAESCYSAVFEAWRAAVLLGYIAVGTRPFSGFIIKNPDLESRWAAADQAINGFQAEPNDCPTPTPTPLVNAWPTAGASVTS